MRPKDTLDFRHRPADFAVMTTSDTLRPVAAEATTNSLDLTTDVVIVGGGLAGLTLAAALATAGVPVICLDRDTPPTQMEQDFDGRTTALAFCSKQVLDGAGVWKHMADDAEAILDIRVVDQDSPLFLHYDHQDVGIGPFGWIADNIVIRRALFARVAELPGLRHIVPASVTRIDRDVRGATGDACRRAGGQGEAGDRGGRQELVLPEVAPASAS